MDQSNVSTSRSGPSSGRAEGIAKIGTVISAIMASSCCWLPPILILMGVSGAGMTQALEAYRPWFMVVTFGFLGTAFYFTYRPRRAVAQRTDGREPQASPDAQQVLQTADCCAPVSQTGKRRFNMMALNKAMLWAVTAMAVVFLFFPGAITGMLGAGGGEVTAGMQRTVLTVEGMTCDG